jgi:lipoprotein NlpI
VDAYFNRGAGPAKLETNDYAGAISDFDECIKLDDKDSNAYCNRGMATFERKYYDGPLKRRPV